MRAPRLRGVMALVTAACAAVPACRLERDEDEAVRAGAKPLSATEVRRELGGTVLAGVSFRLGSFFYVSLGAGGAVKAKLGQSFGEARVQRWATQGGTWHLDPEGRLCLPWGPSPGRPEESCYRVYGNAARFAWYDERRSLAATGRVAPEINGEL